MTKEKQKKEIFEAPPLEELKKRNATFCSQIDTFNSGLLDLLRDHLEGLINAHFEANPLRSSLEEYYVLHKINVLFPHDWSNAVNKLWHMVNKRAHAELCNPVDESETRVGDDGSRKCKFKTGCGYRKGVFRWFASPIDTKRRRECLMALRAELMTELGPDDVEDIELRYCLNPAY